MLFRKHFHIPLIEVGKEGKNNNIFRLTYRSQQMSKQKLEVMFKITAKNSENLSERPLIPNIF